MLNIFTVSKTFRDGWPRIDENPILIAELQPAGRIDKVLNFRTLDR